MICEIWKFPLLSQSAGRIPVRAPEIWKPLSAQMQGDTVTLWAMVDKSSPIVTHSVMVVGTGWAFDSDGWRHLSTVQDGAFVWHVFIAREPEL